MREISMKNSIFWTVLVLTAFLSACDSRNEGKKTSNVVAIEAPDVGKIDNFLSCKVGARRSLSAKEECQIKKLSTRCSVADDCLVSCISSPDGSKVGGGCEHVCYQALQAEKNSPLSLKECDALSEGDGHEKGGSH
jgi:hypothetical protein